MSELLLICGYGVCFFMALMCATLLWLIWTDKIDLSSLLSEANGQASMSRFQLLVFTLVVAISYFLLAENCLAKCVLPDIPSGVLTLLGISASTYAVGKGISYSRDEGVTTPEERQKVRDAVTTMSATGAAAAADTSSAVTGGAQN